jgi:predicted DCC family thiol-disulfide oxidoreductase YuxK
MLFDGDCRFCRLWIERWKQSTGGGVEYVELQDPSVAENFPKLRREDLEKAVHFIDAEGNVYRGAEAVFRSLAINPERQTLLRWYERSPGFAHITESAYAFIAKRRTFFSLVTRALWGKHVERSADLLPRWVFLRGLGIIYLIAFVSYWVQVNGLIGAHGITPAADLMAQARRALEGSGVSLDRFRMFPTFCWFSASDPSLHFQCALGTALAVMLIVGVAPTLSLVGLWMLYLSLITVGDIFYGYQWDNLLLEVGLLAIFLAPLRWLPRAAREKPPSRVAVWLLRLLLFKLMFLSGVVKLTSGDTLWRNLTALSRHYETQPLPNAFAWQMHQMPLAFQKGSCVLMFAIELVAPFLLLAPRRLRMAGGISIAALQIFILLTGNYTFFNWLTIVLCVLSLDDFTWAAIVPRKLSQFYANRSTVLAANQKLFRLGNLPVALIALVFGSISLMEIVAAFGALPFWSRSVVAMYRWVSPLRSINSYGLFAVMTPDRPEIIVEGSNDGSEWKEYLFRYKPGPLNRRPPFVAPHQPRLDWQMWFAALSDVRENGWFVNFCARLLQGSPEVIALLEENPFPTGPPKFIRARLYDYQFTTREERRRTGNWWKRELKREYLPAISLEMLQRAQ